MNLLYMIGRSEFVFEMLLFSFLLCRHFVRRSCFALRAAAGISISIFSSTLMILIVTGMWESIFCICIMYLLCLLSLWFCYENSPEELFFVCTAAYIYQIILYSVFIILNTLLPAHSPFITAILYSLLLAAAAAALTGFIETQLSAAEEIKVHPAFTALLLLTAASIDIIFKYYMVDHSLGKESGGIFIAWKGFSMVSCLVLLAIQFTVLKRNSVAAQNRQLEELLYQRQKQYELSRKNMELINIKCHDLKHWFQHLQTLEGTEYQKEAAQIQKALNIYDSIFHTGNETLDTILTEKKLYCEYNNINLTCIAEGDKLNFFSTGEICSLFGNILDNAVEAASQIEDSEKRTISLIVRLHGSLLSVHEENYYSGELKTLGEGFETTKADSSRHGFGLKSIRMIVSNHHGSFSVTAENNIFNLNILIPLPEEC